MARFTDIIPKDSPDGLQFVDHIDDYSDGHPHDNGSIHSTRNDPIKWPVIITGSVTDEMGTHEVTALAQEAIWDNVTKVIMAATSGEIELLEAHEAAIATAEQMQALSKAKKDYGDLILAIQGNLSVLGYTLPCDSATVLSELTAKSLARELSDNQKESKSDLADLYMIAQGKGVSDSDIANLFAYIQAGGE